MEVEISVEAKKQRLNRLVALTVVLFSVFMGVTKIKDDNLVQAMQLAKADAVDHWSEYQAKKIKLHLTEASLDQARMFARVNPAAAATLAADEARLKSAIERYQRDAVAVQAQAKASEAQYNALNVHDDQFDLSDAALSIAIACAAVAALVEGWLPLLAAWAFGAVGVVFGVAGFAAWSLHPDWIMSLLS